MIISSPKDVAIIGGGGHSKVVIDALLLNNYSVVGIYDDDKDKLHEEIYMKIKVIGNISQVDKKIPNFICAIGNNSTREKIVSKYPELNWVSIIHPSVHMSSTVKIGKGTFIGAGSIIQSDVKIGDHVIINTGACVDHDCIIENFTHVCPRSILCGNVTVKEGSMIGAGTVIIHNHIIIDENSITGAGSVIIKDVSKNIVVVGNPAKKIYDRL